MKKRIIICLVALIGCAGFAESNEESAKKFNDGISSGGFWIMEEGTAAGCGEWSFPLFSSENGFLDSGVIEGENKNRNPFMQ